MISHCFLQQPDNSKTKKDVWRRMWPEACSIDTGHNTFGELKRNKGWQQKATREMDTERRQIQVTVTD
jgi:hypothetical protein